MKKKLYYFADQLIAMFVTDDVQLEMLDNNSNYNTIRVWVLISFSFIILFLLFLIFSLVIDFNISSFKKEDNNVNTLPERNMPTTITNIKFANLSASTSYYNIIRMDNDELVKGYKGAYYFVDLKSGQEIEGETEILNFKIGKYWIESTHKRFEYLKTFDHLVWKVIDPCVRKGLSYQIFIRGYADNLPFANEKSLINPTYKYESIKYLLKDSTIKNEKKVTIYNPTKTNIYTPKRWISNQDLPNLRAKYVKDFIVRDEFTNLKTPIILEGDVIPSIGGSYRSVELIIFIEPKN